MVGMDLCPICDLAAAGVPTTRGDGPIRDRGNGRRIARSMMPGGWDTPAGARSTA